MLLENICDEMAPKQATNARSSTTRRLRVHTILLIYLFVYINQGHGIELTSIYKGSEHYWPLRNVSDNTSLDVVALAHASLPNGGKLNETKLFGRALVLDGLDDCIIIDLLSEDCTNAPSRCHDGFTISFWLFYIRGEFLLCTGGYTNKNKGPGIKFTFNEKKQLFVLEISTIKVTWNVSVRMIRRTWVHVAFTWSTDTGIQLYMNGTQRLMRQKTRFMTYAPVLSSGWSLGRPNQLLKLNNYGSFGISHLALWLRELTDVEIKTAYLETIFRDKAKVITEVSEMVDGQQTQKNTTKQEKPVGDARSKGASQSNFRSFWFLGPFLVLTTTRLC